MKKIEELEKIEGNGKVILLNTDNGHWARMSKEWYNRSIQTVEEKEKFGQMLEERFGLLGEGVEKSHSIKSIYYSMTGKCNLNCEFCTMNSGPHVSTENDLTLSEIRNNLIPKLQKLNPRKVILTGGEPLVRKDVNEIIQSFSEVFGREKIILQSNGLLLTVEQLRKISGDIGILEISIENIFENPKLQEHMEQFFKCANELGIRLSLSFVVDSKSRKYLYDAIELCHKYEANLTTRIVALVGRAVENSKNDSILEEQNTLRVQYDIISYLLKRRYFEDILVGAYIGNLQAKKCCGAFGNILAIHPDGSTLMCGNFKHKKYSMGNIKTKSMEEICKDLDEKLSDVAYEAEFFVDKFHANYTKQYNTQMNLEVVYSVNINSGGLLIYLLADLIWLIGGFGIINGVLTIGTVTALINYQGMLISPMAFFSEFNNSYQGTVIALKRLYSVLCFEEENNEGTVIRSNNIEKVDFHDVSFRYRKDVPVLDNVNIQLRKGTIVGFIGGSGCGKSSLVKMLLRLYAPYKGTISIDGEKIQDISINSLRNRIAFVAQDSLFFRGSILENLKMGNVVDNTKLIEYSKLLDLYDEIVCLPKKWDTELNAGTSNLSGGQKKRLDVLRALMKESDIIIFDESTASIDIERRKRLFEILDKIKQEKIIIFITHNIEECVYCDQIYAVKNRSVQQISYKNLSEAYS